MVGGCRAVRREDLLRTAHLSENEDVYDIAAILQIYQGSNGEATTALYRTLESMGTAGTVATNLFRACKASERAKVYRGSSYRGAAYDKKQWSMNNLCATLVRDAEGLGIVWGWGVDDKARNRCDPHFHVLYIDLPTGQVSFHSGERGQGPDYVKAWDGVKGVSADRICRWTARLFQTEAASNG